MKIWYLLRSQEFPGYLEKSQDLTSKFQALWFSRGMGCPSNLPSLVLRGNDDFGLNEDFSRDGFGRDPPARVGREGNGELLQLQPRKLALHRGLGRRHSRIAFQICLNEFDLKSPFYGKSYIIIVIPCSRCKEWRHRLIKEIYSIHKPS